MNNLDWCLKKLNEVAQDLREPQRGALLEHQAAKLDEVREKLNSLETCAWDHDEDDCAWETECGQYWQFTDGGPEDNHVRFCHFCGKLIDVLEPDSDAPDITPNVHGSGTGED
jgi:hypothetical protein